MSFRVRVMVALLASLVVFAATSATTVAAGLGPGRQVAMGAHVFFPRGLALQSRAMPFATFKVLFGSGSSLVGVAPVGAGPGADALDAATHTLYVASGFNDNGKAVGGNTVSVIDTRRCSAEDVSRPASGRPAAAPPLRSRRGVSAGGCPPPRAPAGIAAG